MRFWCCEGVINNSCAAREQVKLKATSPVKDLEHESGCLFENYFSNYPYYFSKRFLAENPVTFTSMYGKFQISRAHRSGAIFGYTHTHSHKKTHGNFKPKWEDSTDSA